MQNLEESGTKKGRIYLAGFMGSGKSTVGPMIANTIGYTFADLDRLIEAAEGISVTAIFKTKGEEYFRALEREQIRISSGRERFVLALGGGTLGDPENFECIRRAGILIYLRVSVDLLVRRLQNRQDRPLLMDEEGNRLPPPLLRERIARLLEQREPLYSRAEVIIDVDERRVGITVDRLVRALHPFLR